MARCPFCNNPLPDSGKIQGGWNCECGEWIPKGFEIKEGENCEDCPVLYCPERKKPDIKPNKY
jgi:hypothetical protein